MLQIEAIARILKKKGIATKEDIVEEVKQLKNEMAEKIRRMSEKKLYPKKAKSIIF